MFYEKKQAATITGELALEWAMLPKDATPHTWAFRLGVIRSFAKYRRATDRRTQIPSSNLLPIRYRRRHPYIYKEREIRLLLIAAKSPLNTFWGLDNFTLYCIIELAVATGLRRIQLLNLDLDVTIATGINGLSDLELGFKESF